MDGGGSEGGAALAGGLRLPVLEAARDVEMNIRNILRALLSFIGYLYFNACYFSARSSRWRGSGSPNIADFWRGPLRRLRPHRLRGGGASAPAPLPPRNPGRSPVCSGHSFLQFCFKPHCVFLKGLFLSLVLFQTTGTVINFGIIEMCTAETSALFGCGRGKHMRSACRHALLLHDFLTVLGAALFTCPTRTFVTLTLKTTSMR